MWYNYFVDFYCSERIFALKNQFLRGASHGIPIMLGYLSVSFGFGILAVKSGLSIFSAAAVSASNLTSAGQAAGVAIIADGGTLLEMILSQLVINIRYALMAISLSQKLDSSFSLPKRLLAAFGITDEIFAVASSQLEKVTASYMFGLISVSFIGWTTGTVLGASAGKLLPDSVSNAMGIVLYGMFLAIIIPPSRKDRRVLAVVLISFAASFIFSVLPGVSALSESIRVIILTVLISVGAALIIPVKEDSEA